MELQLTQNNQVLSHLESGRPITPIDALFMYGIFRLGARVCDLRQRGIAIRTTMKQAGRKRFAEYSLSKSNV